jgi:competence protein ComEA
MNWRKDKAVKTFLRLGGKFQTSIILALIGTALIGVGLSASRIFSDSAEPEFIPAEQKIEVDDEVVVDISGAVKKPGVYSLEGEARINDAIAEAGGLTKKADKAWVSKNINLAAKLSDSQKIYIPKVGEAGSVQTTGSVSSEISRKININTATEAELDSLPGIGPVRTGKIITNRPYSKIEDLRTKEVLGEATFEKIKDQITAF